MIIRREASSDVAAIRFVNEQAFGGSGEANAIDALRARGAAVLSLGLAPLSVLPDYQRQGIGTALMNAGLEECRRLEHARIIVLGHAEYYPRFGFVRASRYGIRSEWEVPEEAFMILELRPGAWAGVSGVAKYQPEWNGI